MLFTKIYFFSDRCSSGDKCLDAYEVCDGVKNCCDGGDEDHAFCSSRPCKDGFSMYQTVFEFTEVFSNQM